MTDPIDELRNPWKAKHNFFLYLRYDTLTLNLHRAHVVLHRCHCLLVSYVCGVGLADGPKDQGDGYLTYVDALFLCTSVMTTTG